MKFLKTKNYSDPENRDAETTHAEEAKRFLQDARDEDERRRLGAAQIAVHAYAAKMGDPEAQAEVARLRAQCSAHKDAAELARAAAATAQELKAQAESSRQHRQFEASKKKQRADADRVLEAAGRIQKNIQMNVPLLAQDTAKLIAAATHIREGSIIWKYDAPWLSQTWIIALVQAELARALQAHGVTTLVPMPDKYPNDHARCRGCGTLTLSKREFEASKAWAAVDFDKGIAQHFTEAHKVIKDTLAKATLNGAVVDCGDAEDRVEASEHVEAFEALPALITDADIEANEKLGNPAGWPLSGRAFQMGLDATRRSGAAAVTLGLDIDPFTGEEI